MMKKFTNFKQQAKLLLCLLVSLVPSQMQAAGTPMTIPEVIWCEDNNTLYFVMGIAYGSGEIDEETGEELIGEYTDVAGGHYRHPYVGNPLNFDITKIWYGADVLNTGSVTPGWLEYSYDIKHVVIDATFAQFRPKSCYGWFMGCMQLEDITGLENLNTSEVTNMSAMFVYCRTLTSLDLSSFDTSNVTDISGMFINCSALTSLNVSNFDTSNATLTNGIFGNCKSLTSLDVSNFDTSNWTSTYGLFSGCRSLTSLDLSNFDVSNVDEMTNMFMGCSALTTIYCNDTWTPTTSTDMFTGCTSLVGGAGTVFDASHINAAYAHPDGGTANPGYFTLPTPQAIWTAGDSTLTFISSPITYAVGDSINRQAVTAVWSGTDVTASGTSSPAWYNTVKSALTTVVFDRSFASVRPTSLYRWFSSCSKLTAIEGISNLNTSEVTDMSFMFYGCSALKSLDVSNFDTSNVTNMACMFYNCSSLTSLDVSNFYTSKVTNMRYMFYGCSALTSLDLSNFNTRNVTDMSYMFYNCSALTSLDVSDFDTSNVTNMASMFYNCSSLTSLDVSNFYTSKVTDMSNMFNNCSALTSLDVSKFDTRNVTTMSLMFSSCSRLTSLDVSNFYTSIVTNMHSMFSGCSSLTTLDVSNFDTRKVTTMYRMFYRCSALTSLDVSNFDTSKVTSMGSMFQDCSNLTTIVCNDTWKPTNSSSMFDGCKRLVGGTGTTFDELHRDATYARPDGGSANPGYFTSSTKVITANKPDDKETNWTTYYNGGIHTQVIPAEGQTLTVYTAKLEEVEGVRQLTLTTVADNIIMAGQGVIIESNQSDVTLKHSASLTPTGSYYRKNELKGRDNACALPTDEGTIYTMGNVGGQLGFYKYTGSQLKARRAYLAIPAGSEAGIRIRFDGEDTATGLDEVQSTKDNVQSTMDEVQSTIYDLQGRRVVNPTKGIYIVNGKKVYMK